jgi:hypothetical protein
MSRIGWKVKCHHVFVLSIVVFEGMAEAYEMWVEVEEFSRCK